MGEVYMKDKPESESFTYVYAENEEGELVRVPSDTFSGDGKTAYEYAKEGGYEGTEEEFAEKMAAEIPTSLPNPSKLTIKQGSTTITYDGSGAVTVTIPDVGTERIEKLSTDTAVTLEPNKLYVFPEIGELDITLADITDTAVANEFHFIFQSGETATTFSIPDTIKVPDGLTIDANKIYEVSIMEDCLTYQSWAVS